MALEDLHNSKSEELDPENMEDEDLMKKGDLAASLVRSGNRICMAVLEVTGFQFAKEKITQTTAAMDDLENRDKQIKIIGQIIDIFMPSKMNFWEWTRRYVSLDINSRDEKLTRCQFVFEIPSFLIHPLAPSVTAKPISSNSIDTSCYPTWRLASIELCTVLASLLESLEPETEKIIGNVVLLPSINNPDVLPYQ